MVNCQHDCRMLFNSTKQQYLKKYFKYAIVALVEVVVAKALSRTEIHRLQNLTYMNLINSKIFLKVSKIETPFL